MAADSANSTIFSRLRGRNLSAARINFWVVYGTWRAYKWEWYILFKYCVLLNFPLLLLHFTNQFVFCSFQVSKFSTFVHLIYKVSKTLSFSSIFPINTLNVWLGINKIDSFGVSWSREMNKFICWFIEITQIYHFKVILFLSIDLF